MEIFRFIHACSPIDSRFHLTKVLGMPCMSHKLPKQPLDFPNLVQVKRAAARIWYDDDDDFCPEFSIYLPIAGQKKGYETRLVIANVWAEERQFSGKYRYRVHEMMGVSLKATIEFVSFHTDTAKHLLYVHGQEEQCGLDYHQHWIDETYWSQGDDSRNVDDVVLWYRIHLERIDTEGHARIVSANCMKLPYDLMERYPLSLFEVVHASPSASQNDLEDDEDNETDNETDEELLQNLAATSQIEQVD